MELSAVLAPVRHELDAARDFLTRKLRSSFEVFGDISRSMMQKQGKLLRPAVFFLSARSFGEVEEEHVRLAGALELVHAGSLAHDDVIDSACLRRSAATIRARWGDRIAVLYGDFLLAEAFSLLSATPIAVARRLAPPLVIQVIEGEAMQHQTRHRIDLAKSDYLDMIRRKTASLFAAASQIGGASVGAGEALWPALLDYGTDLGTAYQIVDDVLDLIGSEEETGKTVGTDLRSGRFTLPILLLRDGLPTQEVREAISKAARSDDGSATEQVVQLAKESGAVAAAAREAMDLLDSACDALRPLPDSAYKDHLRHLAAHFRRAAEGIARRCPAGTGAPVASPGAE